MTVPKRVSAILSFVSGASVTMTTSFDVWKHRHSPIEPHGREGTMVVLSANRFQGEVRVSRQAGDWAALAQRHRYGDGNCCILGLVDMAAAIPAGRPHRAYSDIALHVPEVIQAIATAAETGAGVTLHNRPARPSVRNPLAPGRLPCRKPH